MIGTYDRDYKGAARKDTMLQDLQYWFNVIDPLDLVKISKKRKKVINHLYSLSDEATITDFNNMSKKNQST